eukprot:4659518-Alexandrium_andersonii.AAC.1
MSASLVGSEMCIRDRAEAYREPAQKNEPGLALTCAARSRGGGCRTGAPVSYTHLTLPTICSV